MHRKGEISAAVAGFLTVDRTLLSHLNLNNISLWLAGRSKHESRRVFIKVQDNDMERHIFSLSFLLP